MNTETILMIEIFQEADPLGSIRVSPEEYLDRCDFEIDRIGRVFKYLGLAQGGQSDLCWQPTPMLMKIIAERVAHPPVNAKGVEVTDDERSSVEALIMRATGDIPDEESMDATEFCCSVLAALGLLTEGAAGAYKPTDRLQEVMRHAPLQRMPGAARS